MTFLEAIAIQLETVLGNGPMNEVSDYPTSDDPNEAFNDGHTRAWWEACQMLEPIYEALREQTEGDAA